jgi:hypothetical protein
MRTPKQQFKYYLQHQDTCVWQATDNAIPSKGASVYLYSGSSRNCDFDIVLTAGPTLTLWVAKPNRERNIVASTLIDAPKKKSCSVLKKHLNKTSAATRLICDAITGIKLRNRK